MDRPLRFFARAGVTEAARVEARSYGALLVDLKRLDRDLGRSQSPGG